MSEEGSDKYLGCHKKLPEYLQGILPLFCDKVLVQLFPSGA